MEKEESGIRHSFTSPELQSTFKMLFYSKKKKNSISTEPEQTF